MRVKPLSFALAGAGAAVLLVTLLLLGESAEPDPRPVPTPSLGRAPETGAGSGTPGSDPANRSTARVALAPDAGRDTQPPAAAEPVAPNLALEWAGIPTWFADREVLPGVPLDEFDPADHDLDALGDAGVAMQLVETEYERWLWNENPALRYRLVDREAAEQAVEAGGVVIDYKLQEGPRYLICDGREAAPLLRLRELFHAMVWSDTYIDGILARQTESFDGAHVHLEPTPDGNGFTTFVNGEKKGAGWFHVPGSLE